MGVSGLGKQCRRVSDKICLDLGEECVCVRRGLDRRAVILVLVSGLLGIGYAGALVFGYIEGEKARLAAYVLGLLWPVIVFLHIFFRNSSSASA